MEVTAVLDFVCPWCFIGSRRLRQALDGMASGIRVIHRPFMLDPFTRPEGEDLREMLSRKFRASPEPMFRHIEAVARESGIPLDFERVRRAPNTLRAHTLVRHTAGSERQHHLVDRVFAAYFIEGADIGQPEVLTAIAESCGMPVALTQALLTSDVELAKTHDAAIVVARAGISAVPHFEFGGGTTVVGAQPIGTLRAAIEDAMASVR